MSLLNRLKKVREREREIALLSECSSQEMPVSAEQEWLTVDRTYHKAPKVDKLTFHPVNLRKTQASNLVWAKYDSFKKGEMVWIPAHIIPHAEGVLLAHVPNPISAEEELVEFLGLPAGDYGILAVKRKYIHPYNAAFKDKGGTQQKLSFTQAQDSDCGQKWSPSYAAHMEEVFRKKYSSVSVAKSVYDNVMAAAAHYLKVAVDTMAEEAAYANAPASADDDDDLVSCRPRFNIEDVALVSSNEKVYVRAGDSICYNHKVLRDRGLVTSKILKIRGDSDIVLENGDILFETDLVKVIPVTKCSKSPIFKQMNEHIFVFGDLSTTQSSTDTENNLNLDPVHHNESLRFDISDKTAALLVADEENSQKSSIKTTSDLAAKRYTATKRRKAHKGTILALLDCKNKRVDDFEFHSSQSNAGDSDAVSPYKKRTRRSLS